MQSSPDLKMFGSELKDLKDLLSRMLVKDSKKRLSKLSEIKNHPWFQKNISFQDVEDRRMDAPFVP